MLTKSDAKMLAALLAGFEDARDKIANMAADYRDKYDNKSERWQESDKGEAFSELCDHLDDLLSNVESVVDALGNFELD